MSAVAAPSLLDQPEMRFPLDLGVRIPKIRELYRSAVKNQWDPQSAVEWDELDLSGKTPEQLWAARLYWSRRAWGEYGAISESPALQIRFCQERHPPDMRFFFTIRTQEESRHAEVCYLMAEKLGGYVKEPVQAAFQGSVSTHGVRKMALDPAITLEAIVASLVCAAEEIAFDVFDHLVKITPNPVANKVLRLIMRDEVRHCAFGWAYMERRAAELSKKELGIVEEAVVTMIEKVEMNGYHSAWLAPDNPASRGEVEADRLTYEAGLGATIEKLEAPIFVGSVQRIRRQMEPWGFTLKPFFHPKLGTF
ncbi:MAG: ferritin-like domain-containing protein [Alphaproteobacteria bacterium]